MHDRTSVRGPVSENPIIQRKPERRTTFVISENQSIPPFNRIPGRASRHAAQASAPARRFSPPAGRRSLLPASLTAEAALSLPLFLMAVITLLVFLSLPGKLSEQTLRLSGRARALASAAGTVSGAVSPGSAGPSAGSPAADLWIDLPETLTMSAPFAALPVSPVRLAVRARVRAWTGGGEGTFSAYDGAGSGSGDTVYVTDYESVYHTHADCTHLDLTILISDTAHVGSLRNAYGSRYKPCSGFPKGYHGPVYLSKNGDCYYPRADDPGLTRHVHVVGSEDAAGLPLCERCAAHDP